jgi:hypothetical protein
VNGDFASMGTNILDRLGCPCIKGHGRGQSCSIMVVTNQLNNFWEVMAKDMHRGCLLLRISPPYCIIRGYIDKII